MKCPRCSSEVPSGAFFCPSCGWRVGDDRTSAVFGATGHLPFFDRCPYCFEKTQTGAGFCPSCGHDLRAANQIFQLPIGSVIQNGDTSYLVGKAIGQGGFGITYVGWDLSLSIRVAIKEYFPSHCAEGTGTVSQKVAVAADQRTEYERGLQDFVREARILARYSDVPGIVRVLSRFEANNTSYIIMEYLDGISLGKYIEQYGALSFADSVRLISPLLDALDKVHAQVIHRDVSPQNIMILQDGSARLLDFGAARRYLTEGQTLGPAGMRYGDGKRFSVVLKKGYAPYEQYFENGRQGPWTDVYGAGATLYYMLTGTAPADSVQRMREDLLLPPSAAARDLTAAQDRVIMKALALEPEDRYQTAGELKTALEEAAGPSRKRPLWLLPAAGLAGLALVLALFLQPWKSGTALDAAVQEEAEEEPAAEEAAPEPAAEEETAEADTRIPLSRWEKDKLLIGGHYYQVLDDSVNFEEAREACEAMGGHLATVTSQEELDMVRSRALTRKFYWLGAREVQDGVWEWVTGEYFDDDAYHADSWWGRGQPDDRGGIGDPHSQNFLCYRVETRKFDDQALYGDSEGDASVQAGGASYICEWDLVPADLVREDS